MAAPKKKPSPLEAALELQNRGDSAGAEAGFHAVLAKDPEDPVALVLLGQLFMKTGRAAEAVPLIEQAIAAAPKRGRRPEPVWRVALAHAKRDAGDLDGALAIFDALVREAPGVPEPLFLRAGLLQRMERHVEAIRDYEAVLKKASGNSQVHNNIAISLMEEGRLKEAFEHFERAEKLDPKNVKAIGNLGAMLLEMGHADAAIARLRRARSLARDDRKVELALIEALQAGDHTDEAERLAEAAHRRDPDDLGIMVRLGNIRMVMGRREEAVALARRVHEAETRMPGALSLLAEADREADAESLLEEIESVLAEYEDGGGHEGLHFAAARLCEKLKRHPEAFAHYAAGNSVRWHKLAQHGKGYDRTTFEAKVDALITAFDAARVAGPGASDSELPVFIVGMPRSGTTLTEQILASHPAVAGAGELNEISRIVGWMTATQGYPAKLPLEALRDAAPGYLQRAGRIGKGATRVTDKMPGNFVNIGLIARLYPKARIIHCRRDPMDNCLSCFAQNFKMDGLAWSTDLEDLAHQYCQYRRLMEHWRTVLPPGRMLEVDYEETVADLEGQARRIVAFAGLPWDDACLSFHKTERAVATASREQVRNPIYSSSVGRWKRYGDGVLPLARALESCGCGPGVDKG